MSFWTGVIRVGGVSCEIEIHADTHQDDLRHMLDGQPALEFEEGSANFTEMIPVTLSPTDETHKSVFESLCSTELLKFNVAQVFEAASYTPLVCLVIPHVAITLAIEERKLVTRIGYTGPPVSNKRKREPVEEVELVVVPDAKRQAPLVYRYAMSANMTILFVDMIFREKKLRKPFRNDIEKIFPGFNGWDVRPMPNASPRTVKLRKLMNKCVMNGGSVVQWAFGIVNVLAYYAQTRDATLNLTCAEQNLLLNRINTAASPKGPEMTSIIHFLERMRVHIVEIFTLVRTEYPCIDTDKVTAELMPGNSSSSS